MHHLSPDIPTHFETERLHLRCYQAGDGTMYYAVSQKNRAHLARYESGNVIMAIQSEEQAEAVVRDLAARWMARDCFFLGAFLKGTDTFVAQVYVGPVNWDLPEFEIGYFVDRDYEGQRYVTEAVRATLQFVFEHLGAHRVRLECDDTNGPSIRVAKRCGMVQEGHIRENKRRADGTFSGTVHCGLLRDEWHKCR
jgi:RimJ/RimL family protein N-acetyltransferase